MRLPDLRDILVGDCPRVRAASFNDRCAVHYPRLAEVPLAISSLVETRMGLLWGPFSETPLEIVAGH